MTQPDHEWAGEIRKMLDQDAERLNPRIADRLATARQHALSHYREQPADVLAWAAVPGAGGRHPVGGERRSRLRLLMLGAALLCALAIGVSWKTGNSTPDIADLDAALLTDELPINAYLDKGFDAWVRRGSR